MPNYQDPAGPQVVIAVVEDMHTRAGLNKALELTKISGAPVIWLVRERPVSVYHGDTDVVVYERARRRQAEGGRGGMTLPPLDQL